MELHRRHAKQLAMHTGKGNVNDRRLMMTSWLEASRAALANSGKLLFGLGMASALPRSASAARKDKRAGDDSVAKEEERREERAEETDRGTKNQEKDQHQASSEDSKASNDGANEESKGNTDRDEKRERRDERSADNDSSSPNDESVDAGRRSVSREQQASSDDSGDDGVGEGGRGGRRREELAQSNNRDDEPDQGDTTDDIVPAPTIPSNPNVPTTTVPDPTDADLFIEANPDVVASVSTSGGFAFARSGNVIAVTGPDGAQIIQSDDPDAVVTPAPSPDEPLDDGGNNDIDFSS